MATFARDKAHEERQRYADWRGFDELASAQDSVTDRSCLAGSVTDEAVAVGTYQRSTPVLVVVVLGVELPDDWHKLLNKVWVVRRKLLLEQFVQQHEVFLLLASNNPIDKKFF